MNFHQKKLPRREVIKFIACGSIIPFIGRFANDIKASEVSKTGKTSKQLMQYQDTPQGDKKCSNCVQFIPGKTSQSKGECKIVEGAISPEGWCNAFSPK